MRRPFRARSSEDQETTRLEAFSDGVIAIAITLPVLEMRVPLNEDAPPAALWQGLRALWPDYCCVIRLVGMP